MELFDIFFKLDKYLAWSAAWLQSWQLLERKQNKKSVERQNPGHNEESLKFVRWVE